MMGEAIGKSWTLVDLPFKEEYPGGRQWNMDAAQLRYEPAILSDEECPSHSNWDKILNHIGQDLNAGLRDAPWAQKAGIKTGAQYLLAWVACMIRHPFSPLPYLFLFGPENSGKSIFHEAIALLMTKGCVPANRALTSTSDFNGELANCVLAIVEEKDISKSKGALNKIKEWVTARMLSIRKMRCDSYSQPNTTHWVQCANKRENCPIFPGDTRITAIHVPDLLPDQEIPKEKLIEKLTEEAPHFMYSLVNIELPEPSGRLRLPIVVTNAKVAAQELNGDGFAWANERLRLNKSTRSLPFVDEIRREYVKSCRKAGKEPLTNRAFGTKLIRWAKSQGFTIGAVKGPTQEDGTRPYCYRGGLELLPE